MAGTGAARNPSRDGKAAVRAASLPSVAGGSAGTPPERDCFRYGITAAASAAAFSFESGRARKAGRSGVTRQEALAEGRYSELRTLLRLQDVDLRIEALQARELEIPREKGNFEIHRQRLAAELAEREKMCKDLLIQQRETEVDIEQRQTQIKKYDQQLFLIKKNEEYQALVHEMDMIKKQVAIKEEHVITLMVDLDDAKARLDEDRKRIDSERKDIERRCVQIDAELAEAVREREALERERDALAAEVDAELLGRYARIRKSKKTGPAVVPLNGESCSGCFMHVPPQMVNEILAGEKIHSCNHCGRLLYHRDNFNAA